MITSEIKDYDNQKLSNYYKKTLKFYKKHAEDLSNEDKLFL
jgi:hypothetical protein